MNHKIHPVFHAYIEFNEAESDVLFNSAETHYDGATRALAKPGGIIYGIRNGFILPLTVAEKPVVVERLCSFRDIDSMMKAIEFAKDDIGMFKRFELIVRELRKAASDAR